MARLAAFKALNEPGEVGPKKFEEYFRVFDKALVAFAIASIVALAAPAFVLWFVIGVLDLVVTYGWGHVPPASMPVIPNSVDYIFYPLAIIGHLGTFAASVMAMLYARRCAEAVGLSGYHWTFGWTCASFFVPFLNFVRPWLGFGEIRRSIVASQRDKTSGQAWHSESFSPSTLLLSMSFAFDLLVNKIASVDLARSLSDLSSAEIALAADVVFLGYLGWYILSLRPLLIGLGRSQHHPAELPTQTASPSVLSARQERTKTSEPSEDSIQLPSHGGSNDQVWQTFLDYDSNVSDVVERLSSLSPKNVEEFRALLLQHCDSTRIKEFEDEAIRRVQGSVFVGDAALRQAYESLNSEDDRLGDELVRVVGIIGKPEDLGRTVDQVRKKVAPRENLAGASSELFKCLLADETVGSPEFEEQQGRAAHAEIAIPSPQIPKQTSEAAEPIAHSDSPPQTDSPVPDEISGSTAVAQKSRVPVSAVVLLALVIIGGCITWLISSETNSTARVSSAVRIAAEERRQQVQTGKLSLVESKLTGITNIDAADQLITTRLGFYRLPSHAADIVESEESWWWEPKKNGPNDFRMYIRNPSNTTIVGLLLKIHEGDCPSLKADPKTSWDYFFLQFSSPLGTDHAGVIRADMPFASVIRADMPFATHFRGCAIVTDLYAASQNTPRPSPQTLEDEGNALRTKMTGDAAPPK